MHKDDQNMILLPRLNFEPEEDDILLKFCTAKAVSKSVKANSKKHRVWRLRFAFANYGRHESKYNGGILG